MITIRKATADDIPFIEANSFRLLDFEMPSWRAKDLPIMTLADINHSIAAIYSNSPDTEAFVAIDENGTACGFLHLDMATDYYTKEKHAHVTDIVVAKDVEGKGIGKLLLAKADEWARERQSRWITLHVFENNNHAQVVYEKSGYQKEWIKYLKPL